MQQVVEALEELRPRIGGARHRVRLAVQHQTVLVIVFLRPARNRQALVFILHVTPQDIVERPERVQLEMRQRIARRVGALVLEALRDGVDRLGQHAFFVPVGPDELDQDRFVANEHSIGEHIVGLVFTGKGRIDDAIKVGVIPQEFLRQFVQIGDGKSANPRLLLFELVAMEFAPCVYAAVQQQE